MFNVEHKTQKALVMSAFCAVNRECVMVIAFFVIYFQNTGRVYESYLCLDFRHRNLIMDIIFIFLGVVIGFYTG